MQNKECERNANLSMGRNIEIADFAAAKRYNSPFSDRKKRLQTRTRYRSIRPLTGHWTMQKLQRRRLPIERPRRSEAQRRKRRVFCLLSKWLGHSEDALSNQRICFITPSHKMNSSWWREHPYLQGMFWLTVFIFVRMQKLKIANKTNKLALALKKVSTRRLILSCLVRLRLSLVEMSSYFGPFQLSTHITNKRIFPGNCYHCSRFGKQMKIYQLYSLKGRVK